MHDAMLNYKSDCFDPIKFAIRSILRLEVDFMKSCGDKFEKTFISHNKACFIEKDNILFYVDFACCIILHSEASTKVSKINGERTKKSTFIENAVPIPNNDQHRCFYDEARCCNIFENPYKLWAMDAAALLALNHNPDKDIMTIVYAQPSTHQSKTDIHPIFSSL